MQLTRFAPLSPTFALATLASLLLLAAGPGDRAHAGDWPQILGPGRNGVAEGEVVEAWPGAGPQRLWEVRLGQGYAGPAVQGDRVIVFHRVGDLERLEALERNSGQTLWKADSPARYRGGIDPDSGPRCVPLIHGGSVLAFGAAGDLVCVELQSGKLRWSRKLHEDFNAMEGYFGAGSTPLVVDDTVLVNVGGRDAGLVALDLRDGSTRWQRTNERASYASPVVARVDGATWVIFVTRLNVVAVEPTQGEERFRFEFGNRGPTVNAATPVVFGDHLFVTANYGVGARLTRLSVRGADPVWVNDESLSSQYPTPVYHNGFLYGIHGREDVGVADLRCVEALTGRVKWSQDGFGMAHLIRCGDRLLVHGVDGRLVLAKASPEKFEVLAEARVARGITRALPALSNGQYFVRERTQDGGRLRCFQLADRT